jgi:hypothetical protein
MDRRTFLGSVGLAALAARARAEEVIKGRPEVTLPRATSGDTAVEPDWAERLTVTVGLRNADIVGKDQRAIQAAVDYVARLGGGTVEILPGKYVLRNAVYLASKVALKGHGQETILEKAPSTTVKLAVDSDWYDQEITLAEDAGFRVGDGICLRTKNPHNGGIDIAKRTLVARDGKRFKLDRALRQNFWQMGDSTAATLFPILSGENVTDLRLENLVLDGNRTNNENLDGNYAGCVFLQDVSGVLMRGVTARNYNGDGLSWQIAHDVMVEECYSHDHAGLGLHPGSGSQRPVMRGNRIARCDIGVFFCWGVKYGLADGNEVEACRVGISIGHRDTDNLIQSNVVRDSGEVGILFRPERGRGFTPDRNRVVANRVENSGGEQAAAIDLQGTCGEVALTQNMVRESRGPAQRIGLRIGPEVGLVALSENRFEGLARQVEDSRPGSRS